MERFKLFPVIELLEDRQLLTPGNVMIGAPQPNLGGATESNIWVWGSSGLHIDSKDNQTMNTTAVVGGSYFLNLDYNFPAGVNTNAIQVTYTIQHALDSHKTNYTNASGSYTYLPSTITQNLTTNPTEYGINWEFDNFIGTDVVTVDVKYDPTLKANDDIYIINYNIVMPHSALTAQVPPQTGPSAFQFSIFAQYTLNSNGTYSFTETPVPFGFSGTKNSTQMTKESYILGLKSPGMYPIQFSAQVKNDTPSDGNFFMVQVASLYNATVNSLTSNRSPVNFNYKSPQLSNGNFLAGIDNTPNPFNSPALNDFQLYVRANQTSYQSLPSPNVIPGYNGRSINFYWDNPGNTISALGDTGSFPNRFIFNGDFNTYVCFQPIGSNEVIVLDSIHWTFKSDVSNPTALANPNWNNSFGSISNWIVNVAPSLTFDNPINNQPRLLNYTYNIFNAIKDPKNITH